MSDMVKRPYRSIVRDLCKPGSDRVPVYDADVADDMFRALDAQCTELERRPTIAKFNVLQEECDWRLTMHQRQIVQTVEQAKTIERLEAMLAEAQKHLTLSQLVTMQAALEGK